MILGTFNGLNIVSLPCDTMPYVTAPSSIEIDPQEAVAASVSPFTGQTQSYDWQASWWMGQRAGSANSDGGLSGGSVRRQPKMVEMRRSDEQTSASEPHSDLQGEGGIGRDQGRKDAIGVGGTV